jgi:hypothetical protein
MLELLAPIACYCYISKILTVGSEVVISSKLDQTESLPAKRVGSGGPPEEGDDIGKAPLGLSFRHQILTPIVPVRSFLVLECNYV